MVRFLQRRGWWVERIHGSHHIMHHAELPDMTITIAIHGSRTMPTKAIVATLKAAEISVDEFNREA